jgi:hypothetical protein
MADKIRTHNCKKKIIYKGEYQFNDAFVYFYGNCSVCGKVLVETFKSIQIDEL